MEPFVILISLMTVIWLSWNWFAELGFYRRVKWDYSKDNPRAIKFHRSPGRRVALNRMRVLVGYPFSIGLTIIIGAALSRKFGLL
jgi:hypothetical protein